MLKKLRIEFICVTMMIVTGMLAIILGLFFYFVRGNLAEQSVRALQTIGRDPFYEARPEIPVQNAQFPFFFTVYQRKREAYRHGRRQL